MSVLRAFWLGMTAIALGYAALSAHSPVSEVSLGCAKIGEFDVDTTVHCSDPIVDVYGVWRLVLLGGLLSAPPLMAALSTRRSVRWVAVGALVVIGLCGLMMWTSFWSLLMVAFLFAVAGSLAIVIDTTVRAQKRERQS